MSRLRLSIVLFFAAASAHAGTAYKCVSAQGAITYQDHACTSGDRETQIEIQTAYSAPKPDAPPGDDAPAAPPVAAKPPPAAPRPARPLPPLWMCTRPEDGKQYVSTDGVVQPRLVPLGVLGVPGKSLAQAYGPGGIGVSAPELAKPSIATPGKLSPQAAAAGDYTQVQDTCVEATPSQTCDYLRSELDRLQTKLKRAFKDVRSELEPRADEIEDELYSCPD